MRHFRLKLQARKPIWHGQTNRFPSSIPLDKSIDWFNWPVGCGSFCFLFEPYLPEYKCFFNLFPFIGWLFARLCGSLAYFHQKVGLAWLMAEDHQVCAPIGTPLLSRSRPLSRRTTSSFLSAANVGSLQALGVSQMDHRQGQWPGEEHQDDGLVGCLLAGKKPEGLDEDDNDHDNDHDGNRNWRVLDMFWQVLARKIREGKIDNFL